MIDKKIHDCIGCGVCSVACPVQAIKMCWSENIGSYSPLVDQSTCTGCNICLNVCSFSDANRALQAQKFVGDGHCGVTESDLIIMGHSKDARSYIASASGGLTSDVLAYLVDTGVVDAVVTPVPSAPGKNDRLFEVVVSKTVEQLNYGRGSVYGPVDFSHALDQVRRDTYIKKIAVTATPCVARSLGNLMDCIPAFNSKIKYVFVLTCSHNVTEHFGKKMLRCFPKVDGKFPLRIRYRDKTGIKDHREFKLTALYQGGEKRSISRFKIPFTKFWRTYTYAQKACLSCFDFWGGCADISAKDAWGLPVSNGGESVLVVRNDKLVQVLWQMRSEQRITFMELSREQLLESQRGTEREKVFQAHKLLRTRRAKWLISPCLNVGSHIKSYVAKRTVLLNKTFSLLLTSCYEFVLALLAYTSSLYEKVGKQYKNPLPLTMDELKNERLDILYAAGFGYHNHGDEAQLSANLELWQTLKPEWKLGTLTPDPQATSNIHGSKITLLLAPRRCLWGLFNIEYAAMSASSLFFPFFLFKYSLIYLNALLLKHVGFSLCLSRHSKRLLLQLKSAKVLHIGGGGFLTGKTASRLYDNMGLVALAKLLETDVILSGQTIGVWRNAIQRYWAKKLHYAKYIGLRDGRDSVRDLAQIGITDASKIKVSFDDALFCSGADEKSLYKYLDRIGIVAKNNYLAVNVHYWRVPKSTVNPALDKLAVQLSIFAAEKGMDIVFIPMHVTDLEAISYLRHKMADDLNVQVANLPTDFRMAISLWQHAKLVFTFKHHPVVFAMAGAVPTIAMAFENYYFHKNYGALALFGQEKCLLKADSLDSGLFLETIRRVENNRQHICSIIQECSSRFKKDHGRIIKDYLKEEASA